MFFLRWKCLSFLFLGFTLPPQAAFSCFEECNSYDGFASFQNSRQLGFYSQASQDEFVYTILYGLLDKQDTGYYLEIGAGDPIKTNNSYFFEKNFQWKGVSIDISNNSQSRWRSIRKNPLLIEDATQSDYASILQSFPRVIDYLSLDIDGGYDIALQKIPFNDHVFKIITIEHDFYRLGDIYREKEREILTSLGYFLLCSNVSYTGLVFEDWWVHPTAFSPSLFSVLKSQDFEGKDDKQLIQMIQSKICDWNSK